MLHGAPWALERQNVKIFWAAADGCDNKRHWPVSIITPCCASKEQLSKLRHCQVAVLAKKLTPERVTVNIEEGKLTVVIRDEDGQHEYDLSTQLYGAIVIADSRWELLSTKVNHSAPQHMSKSNVKKCIHSATLLFMHGLCMVTFATCYNPDMFLREGQIDAGCIETSSTTLWRQCLHNIEIGPSSRGACGWCRWRSA